MHTPPAPLCRPDLDSSATERPPSCPQLTMDELREITQHLLRFSPDALIVVDDSGQIRFANETVTQVFGYAPDTLLGKPLDTLVPERLRAPHGAHIAGFVRSPNNREMGARIANLLALRADGSEFAAGIRLAPFRLGGKLFVAAAIRDDTERRQVNEALVVAREEAERANRAKSRFLATASHDLRQPIQTIRLLNAAMLKVVPQPEIRDLLQHQGDAIESMTRLLNALLDISRLESGAIQPLIVDVPLAEIFRELRTEFESIAPLQRVVLEFDAGAPILATDRALFYQLLQNLVGNAIKYTDQGKVAVSCRSEPDAVTICVSDTGIGIPSDKLERIFDEYYQVDTHGAKRMGVGLGLAIVKEVSRLLGFGIRISSQVGNGTQASITIPARYLAASQVPDLKPEAPESEVVESRRSRLILVEDNDGVRLATELFLKFEGFQTVSAASVVDAEALFDSMQRHDVVIADYHLDGKHTGLEMLLRLRDRLGYEIPGVVLSGDLPSVLRSVKSPVPSCRFLSKPVDTAALIEAINELSGASRDQDSGAA